MIILFFITTTEKNGKYPRTVGYFKTFEEAEHVILTNAGDIWEFCYDYAVIENIPEGLYQYDQNPTWYHWNEIENCYKEIIGRPEFSKRMVGWAIG